MNRIALCFGWMCAGAFTWLGNGVAQAQTISLDNVAPIQLTTSSVVSAVLLDHQTGNLTVRSQAGNYNQCSAPGVPVITSFFPTSSTVPPSTSITLFWNSSNSISCLPQQGAGTIWGSLGQLPPNGSQTMTAPASPGTITFQLTCSDGSNSDVETTQVTVQVAGGGPSANLVVPAQANYSTTVFHCIEASWTSSAGTAYCRPGEAAPQRTSWTTTRCNVNDGGGACPDPGDLGKLRPTGSNVSFAIVPGSANGTANLSLTCYTAANVAGTPSERSISLVQGAGSSCTPAQEP